MAGLTYLHIFLGEMVPKALALSQAERTIRAVYWPMRLVFVVFYPFVYALNGAGNLGLKLIGVHRQASESDQVYTPEELQIIVEESAEGGALRAESGLLLRELLEFGDRTAGEAMVPRVRVLGIPVGATPAELRAILTRHHHTRYPIYDGDLDHIVGMLHVKDLLRLWEDIRKKSDEQKAPSLLYEEPRLYIKAVRDFVSSEYNKIVVDSEPVYQEVTAYLRRNFPDASVSVELYQDPEPLFSRYGVESEIRKIFNKKVWLKSGGHIIIEEAEGLTVVDVNTGRYQSGKSQEETIYTLNLEAATEIVRQIRLRNLVGIVVVDFIDIKNRQLRDQIYDAFVEALKQDRARSAVLEMSPFGVIQMTRQRVRESLLTELAEPCPYCEGSGYLKSKDTISYEIIREIKSRIVKPFVKRIEVQASAKVIHRLKEFEHENLKHLEKEHGVEIAYKPVEGRIGRFEVIAD